MATNFFFNNFRNSQEQLLIESLIVESIKIYGMDMVYLPKTVVDYDPVYGEAPASRFVRAYPIEMYIRNIDSFEGDGTFLSKFKLMLSCIQCKFFQKCFVFAQGSEPIAINYRQI